MAQQQAFDYYQLPQMPQSMSPPELSPHSFYDTQADFSADSAPSRGSPVSPVFPAASFQLPPPSGGDWPAYFEKPAVSPDLDVFYGEAFGSPMSFLSSQNLTLSPAAEPADLMSDAVAFGREGVNDTQPVFQNLDAPARPQKQQQQQEQQQQQTKFPRPARTTTSTPRPRQQQQQQQQQQQRQEQQQQQREEQEQLERKQTAPQRTSPRNRNDLKRKSSSSSSASSSSPSRSASPEPPARRARRQHADPSKNPHNMIEKRYRVNINEKIVALRDAVPSLRCAVQQQTENQQQHQHQQAAGGAGGGAAGGGESDGVPDIVEELGGLMPARKLNKATILSKATEYITHLEKKNGQLWKENQELERRLAEALRWQKAEAEAGPFWS